MNPNLRVVESLESLGYIEEREIGSGSFGIVSVYRARDGTRVAIKRIRILGDDNYIYEAEIASRLQTQRLGHRNLVNIIDMLISKKTDEAFCMIMQYCDVGNLAQNKWVFEPADAFLIMAQAARGLEYLHQMGIAHRDIKPANIVLANNGQLIPKLCDFGISKWIKEGQLTWSIMGTENYMAPQIKNQVGHNLSVDIWSFGVVLFEMLTGKLPFTYEKPFEKKYELLILPRIFNLIFTTKSFRINSKGLCQLLSQGLTSEEIVQLTKMKNQARIEQKREKGPMQRIFASMVIFDKNKQDLKVKIFEKPRDNLKVSAMIISDFNLMGTSKGQFPEKSQKQLHHIDLQGSLIVPGKQIGPFAPSFYYSNQTDQFSETEKDNFDRFSAPVYQRQVSQPVHNIKPKQKIIKIPLNQRIIPDTVQKNTLHSYKEQPVEIITQDIGSKPSNLEKPTVNSIPNLAIENQELRKQLKQLQSKVDDTNLRFKTELEERDKKVEILLRKCNGYQQYINKLPKNQALQKQGTKENPQECSDRNKLLQYEKQISKLENIKASLQKEAQTMKEGLQAETNRLLSQAKLRFQQMRQCLQTELKKKDDQITCLNYRIQFSNENATQLFSQLIQREKALIDQFKQVYKKKVEDLNKYQLATSHIVGRLSDLISNIQWQNKHCEESQKKRESSEKTIGFHCPQFDKFEQIFYRIKIIFKQKQSSQQQNKKLKAQLAQLQLKLTEIEKEHKEKIRSLCHQQKRPRSYSPQSNSSSGQFFMLNVQNKADVL